MADLAVPEADEERTVRAAQRGDLAAFNTLVLEHQALAYNVAYRILGNRDAAADATQEGFLKAYRKLWQFRGGHFRSWLLHIVTNTCYDMLRQRKRRPSLAWELAEDGNAYDARWQARGESPEEAAIRHELNGRIQVAIGRLPPEQQVMVILHDIEGLTYEEISLSTGTQIGTVKSRLSRGRVRLRELLRTDTGPAPMRPLPYGDGQPSPLSSLKFQVSTCYAKGAHDERYRCL